MTTFDPACDYVVGFSGGKDSTALALRLAEEGVRFRLLMNITGDELDDLINHVRRVAAICGVPLEFACAGFSLAERIRHYAAIPNRFMRWCTRELKIEPTIKWLQSHPGVTLLIGLRADEEEREGGRYEEYVAGQRFPLREWGMTEADVWEYLKRRGVEVPARTDCALCYGQRIGEWYLLWRNHPDRWAQGENLEAETGRTFRSAKRDSWPAAMKDLRALFESGSVPNTILELPLFGSASEKNDRCRVCTM